MAKILITTDLAQEYVDEIVSKGHAVINTKVTEDELKEIIKEVDCIVIDYDTKVKKEMIDEALITGRLNLIIRAGEALENIDIAYAKENGIRVFHTPGATTNAVAEMVIGELFAISRLTHLTNIDMREGIWERLQYNGMEIAGKTLGLIGFGRIARMVAEKARALGMRVIYYDKYSTTELYGYTPVSMDILLHESDFISVHIPNSLENYNAIDEKTFRLMKEGVIFINYSSGDVMDEEAFLEAVSNGTIRGASLDVFKDEPIRDVRFISNRKIFVSPHIGSLTSEAKERISEQVVKYILENL